MTEFPFEFVLKPLKDQTLYDTYHGVYVNVQYMLTADMARGMMSKNLKKNKEFIVEAEVRRTLSPVLHAHSPVAVVRSAMPR